MKTPWHVFFALVVGIGFIAMTSLAQTQERPTAPRTGKRAEKTQGDVVLVPNCFVSLIDTAKVAAGRAGILAIVNPEEGHVLKAGEQVAKVKDEVAKAQFATADKQARNTIEILFGQKSAELATVEWEKSRELNREIPRTIPEIEIKRLFLAKERAELQTQNAEKEHDIAVSKRDEAGELLQTHIIETPISGMVTKVYKRTGEAVREGDAIVDVVNTNRMRVSGDVAVRDINRIRLGDKVKVKLKGTESDEDLIFEGRITFIDVTVSKIGSPGVRVFAEIPNRDGILRDGAGAEMVIYPGKTASPLNATTQRARPAKAAVAE